MTSSTVPALSVAELDLRADCAAAADLGTVLTAGDVRLQLKQGARNVWIVAAAGGLDVLALRLGVNAGTIAHVEYRTDAEGTLGVEFVSALGAMRARVEVIDRTTLHCTTSLMPAETIEIPPSPRDVLMLADTGVVLTHQRGLRSGVVYAQHRDDPQFTMFYLQNFSALGQYFTQTKQTPADTVGGRWPELGYAPPHGDGSVLPHSREVIISDAFVTLAAEAPVSEEQIAALYLDLFAKTYLALERPEVAYHAWPERAADAFRDLTTSPLCRYERQGCRYLMPYVGDETKPPESMVQFTVAVNAGEYDRWRGVASRLERTLRETAPAFFDDEVGSVVRWLPGEPFDESQADDNMNHEAMDSWYLHHALFNAFRFARQGDAAAKELFERSLPYVIRVAHRFNYRWPIFFNLRTLDVIRAEAEPGRGGERDVAGLYALLMVQAYEMFGSDDYLHEAQVAAGYLRGFGFDLAYQLNTTGFAAEAALRLAKITRDEAYLGLADVCLANLFDNMWLWECSYEHARHYRTFFGLFPLRDAPYLAPYEEMEAHGKFHEFLELAGDLARPSLRLLLAEFQKYSLDRCWYYYPSSLPVDGIAEHARNGRVERALAIPLEDLRDGHERSGQVGQELYGAGLPFVLTSRHYMRFADGLVMAYANYPMYDFAETSSGSATWRAGGDPRAGGELRMLLTMPESAPRSTRAWVRNGDERVPLRGRLSVEGHAVFSFRGGQQLEIECIERSAGDAGNAADAVTIGDPAVRETA